MTISIRQVGPCFAGEVEGLDMRNPLSREDIAAILAAADIFALPSHFEGLPMSVIEAMMCGLPAVAFHAGGVEEIIRNEITGKLVRNGDVAETIAAIRTLLGDARLLKVAGPWARVYAVARFSMWSQEARWHRFLAGHRLTGTGFNPPTMLRPRDEHVDTRTMQEHRPSWTCPADTAPFLNREHRAIFDRTADLPGWQTPGDSFKLYEMGYHAGDVILEIGTFGGRSATVALRGALANPARTQPPQFYGIDIMDDSITRTRQILAEEYLGQYCHLHHGVLREFVQRWQITPTMVFLDGDHRYEGCKADLELLSAYLRPGTPVLVHDYLNVENGTEAVGVMQAAQEWSAAGGGRFIGCFGCCALYLVGRDGA